jgi:hypothetical protein
MAFAVTKVQCYGIEAEEPLNKRYRQYMYLNITAANTDVDLDLGDNQTGSLGTFWDAVDGTATGAGALLAIQDIVTRAETFDGFGGEWMSRAQADASASGIIALNSAATAGGNATETLTVTGLTVATDSVLGISQYTDGAGAAVGILAYGTAGQPTVNNQLSVTWNADPGAGALVRVVVSRTGITSVVAGTYQVTYANKTPNILFASGDAPTSYEVILKWILMPQVAPVEYYAQV